MSEVPPGWTTTRLGDLGDVRLGKMLDKAKNQGLPTQYLRNINVRWFRFELADLQMLLVPEDERELLSVQDGDLFICEGGEPGRCAVWRNGTNSLVYQKALHRFRTSGAIIPELLMYRLRHDADSGALQDAFTGTTIKHLTQESLSRYEIPLPPINEQKRIADKLDAVRARVDACRERFDRVPAILKRFRQAVLADATSGKLTEEWREENARDGEWPRVELGDAARDFSYGSAAKSSQSGSVPVLRMGNIQDGHLDWTDLVYTSVPAEITKYKLRAGDVLFNRTNSPELVGKTAVYRGERDAIYAGYLIRVRCTEQLLPDYLNYCLNSPAGRDYCWQVKSDGVSQSNINAKKLAAFEFELPSIEEQHEIVRRVEALFSYADRLEARYTAAHAQVERLTPALLAKAFRGELVPQDPNDEPASMLLERIRAVRGATEGTAGPKRRKGGGRPKTPQKTEVLMLTRNDIQDTHLTMILKDRGPLTAEALWSASELDIDDFYDQLKDEEARGLLQEKRGDSSNAPRMLEAA